MLSEAHLADVLHLPPLSPPPPSLHTHSGMLEGLGVNPNITAVELKLASNDLGQGRDPQNLATVFSRTACLHRLDISDCGLDNILPEFMQQLTANPAIRHLAIGRNFNGKAK